MEEVYGFNSRSVTSEGNCGLGIGKEEEEEEEEEETRLTCALAKDDADNTGGLEPRTFSTGSVYLLKCHKNIVKEGCSRVQLLGHRRAEQRKLRGVAEMGVAADIEYERLQRAPSLFNKF
jgi:hypothetical protein